MPIKASPDKYVWSRYLSGGHPVVDADDTMAETTATIGGNRVMFHTLVLMDAVPDTEACDFSSVYPNAYVNTSATQRYLRLLRWNASLDPLGNGLYVNRVLIYGAGTPPAGAPYHGSGGNMTYNLYRDNGTPTTVNTASPLAGTTVSVPASGSASHLFELTNTPFFLAPNGASNLFLRLLNTSGAALNSGGVWVDIEAVLL